MHSSLPWIFAVSAYLRLTTASPLHTDPSIVDINIRATYNCTDLRAEPSFRCWDELDLSDYLVGWNRTTPTCQATGSAGNDGASCCAPQEPWTRCFLRLSYGAAGSDCSTINSQSCALHQLSSKLDQSIAPKVGYVVRNIVAINNLFTSYYVALRTQIGSIDGSYSSSVNFQQILKNTANFNNGNVAQALLAGLPFWGTSTVIAGGPQQIPANNLTVALAFARSLQNTQAASSTLFNLSSEKSQSVTVGSAVGGELDQAGAQLQSALNLIMTDVGTFSAWAAHGLYSDSTASSSVPLAGSWIESALDTYLFSEILSQSRFSATPVATILSKEDFQRSRTCTALGDVCKDSNGKAYYFSPVHKTQYQVNEPKDWASNSAGGKLGEVSVYGLLEWIETTDVYMPVLFDGAYNCTLEGKAGGSAINFNANNSLDVACLSSLPIYLVKGSPCPAGAVQAGGKCPFGFNG